jgi:hypothetical protein
MCDFDIDIRLLPWLRLKSLPFHGSYGIVVMAQPALESVFLCHDWKAIYCEALITLVRGETGTSIVEVMKRRAVELVHWIRPASRHVLMSMPFYLLALSSSSQSRRGNPLSQAHKFGRNSYPLIGGFMLIG